MKLTQHERFLRDGILDRMIEYLKEYDKKSWTLEQLTVPTFATIIELFEMNRMVLKDIENHLEENRGADAEFYQRMLKLAHYLQSGLRNAYQGVEEEWSNFDEREDAE